MAKKKSTTKKKRTPKKTTKKVARKKAVKKVVPKKIVKKKPVVLDPDVHQIKVKVIGVGGGATSIVADIAYSYDGPNFYVADTDLSTLAQYKRKRRVKIIPFGEEITNGMGTGMNVEMGREAALMNKEKIREELDGADLCIFVSCLGGGTGSGAMPVFARAARETGTLTLGVFTLPFEFERERKMNTAKVSLGQLRDELDAMTVLPNQKIFDVVTEKTPVREALSGINKALGASLEGLIGMIHSPGLINIDFADLETILKGPRPLSYLTRTKELGKDRVKSALMSLTNNPLFPYGFEDADGILFNIEAPHNLTLTEVSDISSTISKMSKNEDAKIIFGVNLVRGKNDLDITLLAVGCEMNDLFIESSDTDRELPWTQSIKQTIKGSDDNGNKERKNALDVQEDLKSVENELLDKEKKWETPAFLRSREDE